MEIEHFKASLDTAMDRIEAQMEETVRRARLKYDSTLVEIYQAKINLLSSLGYKPERVAAMQARVDEIRREVVEWMP